MVNFFHDQFIAFGNGERIVNKNAKRNETLENDNDDNNKDFKRSTYSNYKR